MKAWALLCVALVASACSKSGEVSATKARDHVAALVKVSESDVKELRAGIPQGARRISELYADKIDNSDPTELRRVLDRARNDVQDLRVAKSTFFALVSKTGTVVRSDQDQDLMAGKDVFAAFPELKKALSGAHVETRGAMPEAAGVGGRADGQWILAEPIKKGSDVLALYVTGWSWARYAYRLELSLRGSVQSSIGESTKMPLLYVYLVVGDGVYGAPISPEVNAQAIRERAPWGKLGPDGSYAERLEITERDFGLAVKRAPALGDKVAIAVLRSET